MSRGCQTFLGAGLLLFVAGCGGGGGAASPDAAFKDFQAALKAKDGEKAWKLLSKDAQGTMDKLATAMKDQFKKFEALPPEQLKLIEGKLGVSLTELKAMDAKGLFVHSVKNIDKAGGGEALKEITSATLENVKVEGDKATATFKSSTKSEPILFAKEGGSWRITPPAK